MEECSLFAYVHINHSFVCVFSCVHMQDILMYVTFKLGSHRFDWSHVKRDSKPCKL